MATTESTVRTERVPGLRNARGGISGGAILTGVVVAFGSMSLLTGLIAGAIVALGLPTDLPFPGEDIQGGLIAGSVLVLAEFGSYLWGGYTAGRMARGAGVVNGLLVPLVGFLLVVLLAAIVTAIGTTTSVTSPFQGYSLDVGDNVVRWGAGVGIAMLVAMFLGGGLGGGLGMRWHSRLEKEALTTGTAPTRTDPDGTGVTNLP